MTLLIPAVAFLFAPLAPCFLDPIAQQLAADAGTALDYAGISRQAAAIDLGVPLPKLSDQLNGKVPFTYLWRMLAGLDPAFREEFFDIQSNRAGAMLLRHTDLQRLVRGVEALTQKRRMAKAALPEMRKEQAS